MARAFITTTIFCFIALFTSLTLGANHRHRPTDHTKFLSKRDATLRFPYGSTKIRGVSIGGWLVLEPWITPSLFDATGNPDIIDEYTFGQMQDVDTATAALTSHWNTFITEDDFVAIAAAGLNHVRIPVGYWAFDVSGGEPYIQGQYPYLKQAVTWAQNHGLKILIDLHGAPGSQNGFDNSGQAGNPEWQTSTDNVDRTSAIIKMLAAEFAQPQYASVVVAIAPLNEPKGTYSSQLLSVATQYWDDSYGNIHFPFGNSTEGPLLTVIHDCFESLSHWNGFMSYPGHNGAMMDTHYYQMFDSSQIGNTNQQHITSVCNRGTQIAAYTTLWIVVGEWTTSAIDCAKYLNGRGVGARYDGTYPGSSRVGSCTGLTGSSSGFSSSYKTFLRQMFEAQTQQFEANGNGWIYWTWKNEDADEWSYQKGLAGGWIPQDPTSQQFPNICSGPISTFSTSSSTSTRTTSTTRSSTSTTSRSSTTTTTSRSSTTSTSSRITTSTTSTTSSSSSSTAGPTGAVIHPGASSTKCLTASSNANNAAVEIEDCDGSAGQSWSLVGGTLQTFTNKCLDVTSGSTTNGNKMQIYTCSSGNANQQFATTGSTIAWTGKGECLDLTNGNLSNGNVVQMWTCTGGQNQVWNIVNGSTPPPTSTTSTTTSTTPRTTSTTSTTSSTPPASTAHVIHPGASASLCLTAASNANNAAVEIETCNGSTSQQWTLVGGALQIFGTKCLDVTSGSTANGTKMQIYNCSTGNANQQFTTTGNTVMWIGKGECLDLTDGNTANGNVMQMWACTGGKNQVWNIV